MFSKIVTGIDMLLYSLSNLTKKNLSDYCFIDTASSHTNLVAKDGSLISIFAIHGAKKIVGADELDAIQEKFSSELLPIFKKQGHQIQFVFIRATAGNDRVDRQFKRNWEGAKENKIMRGAYHYYRPNENSIEQADLFIKTVKLKKGDLPPVLDIEKLPKNQPLDSLKKGLKRWLAKVEKHYQVRPIIYSGERYYSDFLKEEFSEYLFWIANYNFYREKIEDDWLFWQFTEKASLPGIKHRVDVNIYNGDLEQLHFITVE